MSFLFENLNKYDSTRKHKAFSYFTVIARNFFIQIAKGKGKKVLSNVCIDDNLSFLERKNDKLIEKSCEDKMLRNEYMNLLRNEIRSWHDKFEKKQEKLVLDAVFTLFENIDSIEVDNKKGIFLYLREISRVEYKTNSCKSIKT